MLRQLREDKEAYRLFNTIMRVLVRAAEVPKGSRQIEAEGILDAAMQCIMVFQERPNSLRLCCKLVAALNYRMYQCLSGRSHLLGKGRQSVLERKGGHESKATEERTPTMKRARRKSARTKKMSARTALIVKATCCSCALRSQVIRYVDERKARPVCSPSLRCLDSARSR